MLEKESLSNTAKEIFIGIGSNLGHRFDNIRKALQMMAKSAIREMRVSVIFETKAILPLDAPPTWDIPYLNCVVSGTTGLSPLSLLKKLKEIEKELGRDTHAPRWAPRTIDLDILAWGEEIISENNLIVPHPELMNRPFFVHLMATLHPNWRYPVPNLPYSHLTLSEILHRHISADLEGNKCFALSPQLVGIVNITPDSFSDGGKYFAPEKAMQKIRELAAEGAAVIDIGAQSTRPGAICISAEEEWKRLEPVLRLLSEEFQNKPAKTQISLDSFYPEVIQKALEYYPIDWINDVKGEHLQQMIAGTKCKIVITHSLTIPASRETVLPFEANPIHLICDWAEKTIDKLRISKERVILDPGIGFGKSSFQSLAILRQLDALKKVGCEILIGHSRKSFLKVISSFPEKDLETVGASHYLMREGVDYLRVHNVEAHHRSLAAAALLKGSY